jgi:hypothetical protein
MTSTVHVATFFHPDYTVGVGLADSSAHRTPALGAMRRRLAGLPSFTPMPNNCSAWAKDHRRSGIGFTPAPCPEGHIVLFNCYLQYSHTLMAGQVSKFTSL